MHFLVQMPPSAGQRSRNASDAIGPPLSSIYGARIILMPFVRSLILWPSLWSMENTSEHSDPSLPLSKVVFIDQICDRFDRALYEAIQNRGPWPSSEDYLGDITEPVRSELRKELLAVEASYRQQQADSDVPSPLWKIVGNTSAAAWRTRVPAIWQRHHP